jgi:hypothetical protein
MKTLPVSVEIYHPTHFHFENLRCASLRYVYIKFQQFKYAISNNNLRVSRFLDEPILRNERTRVLLFPREVSVVRRHKDRRIATPTHTI